MNQGEARLSFTFPVFNNTSADTEVLLLRARLLKSSPGTIGRRLKALEEGERGDETDSFMRLKHHDWAGILMLTRDERDGPVLIHYGCVELNSFLCRHFRRSAVNLKRRPAVSLMFLLSPLQLSTRSASEAFPGRGWGLQTPPTWSDKPHPAVTDRWDKQMTTSFKSFFFFFYSYFKFCRSFWILDVCTWR